ncbi:DUF2227 family putative metal-binding protein [Thermus scotoductus]|uniref:DUF2227 family putative metal-binding protein n=1 Tax=Thermus scotoductus TaxID=37636 RepID=UPI001562D646|nr:DUF2227 family putative metal-binding protein [Thermus scotoductus]
MSGQEHDLSTLALALVGGYALAQASPALGASFALGTLAGGLLLSPDLDLPYSTPSRRWGPLRFLWLPYQALHPHRGRSHTYLYGPLSRLLYLGLLLSLLALPLGGLGVVQGLEAQNLLPLLGGKEALGALGGYFLSQWLHLILDGIPPFRRRKRRSF